MFYCKNCLATGKYTTQCACGGSFTEYVRGLPEGLLSSDEELKAQAATESHFVWDPQSKPRRRKASLREALAQRWGKEIEGWGGIETPATDAGFMALSAACALVADGCCCSLEALDSEVEMQMHRHHAHTALRTAVATLTDADRTAIVRAECAATVRRQAAQAAYAGGSDASGYGRNVEDGD